MGGKGGGSTTTVQKADPWSGQQPYLSEVFRQAAQLYHTGQLSPDYYPGQTVAGQSDWTTQALEMQAERAQNGSPFINNAANSMNSLTIGETLTGNQGLNRLNSLTYDDSSGEALKNLASSYDNQGLNVLNELSSADNPYVDELYNRANSQTQAAINGNFSAAGRYGSGAHAAASADAASNLAQNMYSELWDKRADAAQAAGQLYNQSEQTVADMLASAGQLYNQGFNAQANAAQASGQLFNQGTGQQIAAAQTGQQLANQAYTDSAALSEAGGILDDYNQQLINADIDRWNYDQNKALQALQNYNNLIQGSYGGTTTSTGKQSSGSTLGNVLGGALTGGGLGAGIAAAGGATGSALLANPWTIGGAALGGLLGLF